MQSPSLKDHFEHATILQDKLAKVQEELKSKSHWKALIDANVAPPFVVSKDGEIIDEKASYEKELSQWCAVHNASVAEVQRLIDSTPQSLKGKEKYEDITIWTKARVNDIAYGKVKYTSGFRTTTTGSPGESRRLDWSLIESSGRIGSNEVSHRSICEYLGCSCRPLTSPASSKI